MVDFDQESELELMEHQFEAKLHHPPISTKGTKKKREDIVGFQIEIKFQILKVHACSTFSFQNAQMMFHQIQTHIINI